VEKGETGGGCLLTALGLVAGFAAIEGGIVLIAASLHQILGAAAPHPKATAGATAGFVLVLAGPLLWFLAGRTRPRVTAAQAVAALPDLALAGWFILGWAAPQVIGRQAAGMLVGVMVLEFIIIHASIALVAAPKSIAQKAGGGEWWQSERAAFLGLLLLYSLMAAGISAAFKTAWLFLGFWLLVANKFIGDWLAPAAEAQERMRRHMARWGLSAGLYLLLAFGSIFIPVPRLAAISGTRGGGLWEQHPEQAVMMGAMYFALLGFCELYGGFNSPPAAAVQGAGGNGLPKREK
jgi:hypothetical protein